MKIKRFVGGSLESNGYIISTKPQGNCYIIDPGYEANKFIKYIESENLNLIGIILTHHHHDHVGAAAKIAGHFDCHVMMTFEDSLMYRGKVHKYLIDGDTLDLDGETLEVVATPGHTHGSICVVSPKSDVVFTGDTIFDTDLGRTDLQDGSWPDMVDSCKMVIDKWPDRYTIYPGHDQSATMKIVRKYNTEFLQCLEEK